MPFLMPMPIQNLPVVVYMTPMLTIIPQIFKYLHYCRISSYMENIFKIIIETIPEKNISIGIMQ